MPKVKTPTSRRQKYVRPDSVKGKRKRNYNLQSYIGKLFQKTELESEKKVTCSDAYKRELEHIARCLAVHIRNEAARKTYLSRDKTITARRIRDAVADTVGPTHYRLAMAYVENHPAPAPKSKAAA